MEMITELFEIISTGVVAYADVLVNLFTNIVAIFYVPETGFTIVGVLLLTGICFGICKFGVNLVKSLVRQ